MRSERTALTHRITDEEESAIVYDSLDSWWYKLQQKKLWIGIGVVVVVAVLAAVVLIVALSAGLSDDDDNDNKHKGTNYYESVTATNIQKHLAKLFATANNLTNNTVNSRSVRNGYNESAAYIIQQLEQVVGKDFCEVSTQDFVVPVYQQLDSPKLVLTAVSGNGSFSPLAYQLGVDFIGMRYGGNGTYNISAGISVVANVGCDPSDYDSVAPNSIALIQRGGNCTFYGKALLAEAKNAAAILFYNQVTTTVITAARVFDSTWVPTDPIIQIPSLGISYSVGNTLRSLSERGPIEVNLVTRSQVTVDPTFNVFCTTKKGDPKNIVMAGAHLDSVPEGPGVNDNGSGSSSVLELAVQMARQGITPHNKVTFAWWGAEELGLIGSRAYVRSIVNTTQEKDIVAYLNFDMLGSPNYVPGIHNGTDTPANVRNGSVVIQGLFEEFFNKVLKKPYELTGMSGGSDYYPFVIYTNIAAGGLATGASALKTMDQRAIFGGFADTQLDTCYHMPCDTLDNIDAVCLQDMARAAAYVLQRLALEKDVRKFVYGA
ncbi:PA domain containing protein [Acanthamoeba castellanii str. Neff]|uniref:PA domain containing protein n=1 Tax=Acanthamoeba castellanii (strain ATCC 30010 / Neff) TaxID=1257118 RepID=L8GZN2_ACACF|nr:PA domain containing protein [Acanthamoeba castellanii str. Neff]ELR18699.1 PA domain containing protein [Acanthamoeba castellanii str. Neff]